MRFAHFNSHLYEGVFAQGVSAQGVYSPWTQRQKPHCPIACWDTHPQPIACWDTAPPPEQNDRQV